MRSVVETGSVILEEILSNFITEFLLLCYSLPWKRVGPFISTNLNSLYPRTLCANFGWNWASGLLKFLRWAKNGGGLLICYLPFEGGVTFHLNKLEKSGLNNTDQWFWSNLIKISCSIYVHSGSVYWTADFNQIGFGEE